MVDHTLNIQKQVEWIEALDTLLRNQLSDDISGIQVQQDWVHVYFLVPPNAGDTTATAIVNGHNSLTVDASALQISADGATPTTITVNGLSSFDYAIYEVSQFQGIKSEILLRSGSAPDGVLVLRTDEARLYLIEVIDGFNTGYIEVEAIEA